jgi:hypothetical protein
MSATLVTPKTTSGGEIIRELVNASDGQGLNLEDGGKIELANSAAAEFGTSDFSLEFVLNQTGDNVNDNFIYYTHNSGNSRMYMYNDISANVIEVLFWNSSGTNSTFTLNYDMSQDYGTPTHYVFAFDRSANLTLYKNGNSVASDDISAASTIDIGFSNNNPAQIGTVAGYGVLGTFYRFRAFNTLADAKLLFERADVPQTLTANLLIDLDLAFANPTQSLTVQDRKGNSDGEANSSTLVTQVQPIIQGNMRSLAVTTTSQAAGVPADGEIIAGSVTAKTGTTGGITIDASGQTDTTARFELKADRPSADQDACDIRFYNNNAQPIAVIAAVKGSGANDTDGKLDFYTSNSKRLTIDSSGKIGQNCTPEAFLHVQAADASVEPAGTADVAAFEFTAGAGIDGISLLYPDAKTGQIVFGTPSDNDAGRIVYGGPSVTTAADQDAMRFHTAGTEAMRIDSTGQTTMTAASTSVLKVNRTTSDGDAIIVEADGADRIRIGTEGITFPNGGTTAPGAGDANRLDYYKEGSWVPTLVRGGSAITAGVAYSNQAGNYTRIGKVVYYWFDMTISTLDNSTLNPSSGTFGIGGLPFNCAAATAGGYGAPSFRSMTAIPTSIRNNNNSSFVQEISTYIALFWLNGSAAEIGLDTVTTDLTTGRLTGEGFYFTS